ncbi:MAG: HAMP domain-containing protein, partial [Dehalococcoidia bacterium]|nr:HAMP domain-containing protein [Dehalococcoidia bacterium]
MGVLGKPTLQRRISLLVLAFLAIVLGLFSWLGIQSLNDSAQRTLNERLTNAKMAAAYLDQDLARLLSDLKDHSDFGGSLPQDSQFDAAADYLREEMTNLGIVTEAVFLVGPDGRILGADPPLPDSVQTALASTDNNISESILTGKATVSGLVYEPLTAVPVVFANAPIPGANGTAIGALSVAINMNESSLAAIIRPITLGNTGYAEIVDDNGVVLARTQPGHTPDPFELSDHPDKFAMLISQDQATVRTCHRCHGTLANPQRSGKDVLAFAPLKNAAWGIALRQSETEAFAITNELKRRLLLLGVAVAAAAFLLVWIVTQGVVRPVKALTDAAARVASGDFRVKVPVKGKDEIGQLGMSFSAMTRQLDQTTNELVSRNRELSSLNSIAAAVGQSLDLDEVMARSLERVLEVTQTVGGCVLLASRHGDGESLQVGCRLGKTSTSDCQKLYQLRRCDCREAMRLRQTLLVDDASQCPALGQAGPADKQVAGFVSIPLKSKHQSLGVMNLYFPPGHYFTEQDLKLLDAFGSYV